jgi:hypothetical protein
VAVLLVTQLSGLNFTDHAAGRRGGQTNRYLDKQIDQVLSKLPSHLADNVDAIRVVGNFAAHPVKSEHPGRLLDVEEGEAGWILGVLLELFDFYYVGPAKSEALRARLNQKLEGAGPPSKRQRKPSVSLPSGARRATPHPSPPRDYGFGIQRAPRDAGPRLNARKILFYCRFKVRPKFENPEPFRVPFSTLLPERFPVKFASSKPVPPKVKETAEPA